MLYHQQKCHIILINFIGIAASRNGFSWYSHGAFANLILKAATATEIHCHNSEFHSMCHRYIAICCYASSLLCSAFKMNAKCLFAYLAAFIWFQ